MKGPKGAVVMFVVLVVIIFFMSVVLLKEKERERGGFCKYQDASILIALSWSAF